MYYSILHSNEPDIAGTIIIRSADRQSDIYTHNKLSFFEFPQMPPVFPRFYIDYNEVYEYSDDGAEMNLRSKTEGIESDFLYDYGSIPGKGFVLSENVKYILEEYTLSGVRFYPLEVYTQREVPTQKRYYYMQVINSPYKDWIDYEQSGFCFFDHTQKDDTKRSLPVAISDKDSLTETYKNLPNGYQLRAYKLVFKEIAFLQESPDLFYMRELLGSIIISERLKNKLLQANVTGLEGFYPVRSLFLS